MSKYFCPYCNPKYKLTRIDSSGNLYCGACGESLVKKRTFSLRSLVAILAVFSIIFPILYLLFFSINNYRIQNKDYNQVTTKILII
tara:strand:+ start:16 stop:273 length:258 start_codon:yes stop_codon:yes gene_type:complete